MTKKIDSMELHLYLDVLKGHFFFLQNILFGDYYNLFVSLHFSSAVYAP